MISNNAERVSEAGLTADLSDLEAKVNALLPPKYQYCLDAVNPRSMGSAELKFDSNMRIAWDQIWTHFCDLALAGGPPHRGSLLEAPTPEEVEAEPAGYHLVCEELARGIGMITGLAVTAGAESGWVTVNCHSQEMAAWLLRAVMAENVFVRCSGATIQVPAGPTFRLAKEVKNVVVALAKTCHYWQDHLSVDQRIAAANLCSGTGAATLLEPPSRYEVLSHAAEYREITGRMGRALENALGLPVFGSQAAGWIGLQTNAERTAAWFVRSAIAESILARRENNNLFLPVPNVNSGQQHEAELLKRMIQLQRLFMATSS